MRAETKRSKRVAGERNGGGFYYIFIIPEMRSEGHEGLPRLTDRKEGISKPRDRAELPLS